jgi:uncharacterized protein YwgA/O-acetyl-ADP-ribose deacetylase (regulator of RNase III)
MVKVLKGNVLESNAQTLVNTVNCVGVMGKGVALQFKERFPDMFKDYLSRCQRGEVALGRPYLYRAGSRPWILNFPTKHHWRSVSSVQDIILGLNYLREHHREWGITSLAVPPLGCGEGKLDWGIVGRVLYKYLSRLEIPVELYAPLTTPQEQCELDFLEGGQESKKGERLPRRADAIAPGWVALTEILSNVQRQRYHWPVGRTMFQKIAYLATKQGLPTGLRFQKGSYGPFAPELKRLITKLVNNGLISEKTIGCMLSVNVGPAYTVAREAFAGDLERWTADIERIADLFVRLRTTRQSELVATVVFAAKGLEEAKGKKPSESEVLSEVMEWKQRRRPPFEQGEVAHTIRNLAALGWLDVEPSADLPIPEEVLVGV